MDNSLDDKYISHKMSSFIKFTKLTRIIILLSKFWKFKQELIY